MNRSVLQRNLIWIPLVMLVAFSVLWLLRPRPLAVDLAEVTRAPFTLGITDEGETRVRDVFVVSAPVAGLLRRIELDAGDAVVADETLLARIEPLDPAFLDVRTEAELRAALNAALAAQRLAAAELERASAELDFANNELGRAQGLKTRHMISESALDNARRSARSAAAAQDEARARLAVREFELERARARLLEPSVAREQRLECDCVTVAAPLSGRVLRVLQESEGVIAAGAPLLEIGDPTELEIVVDLLSSDAVQVTGGQRVVIEAWGGEAPLGGVVKRVEPFGFTRVSALGIEEQRVNVIIDLTDPPARWTRLGHGYRVEPRIVLWEDPAALQAPLSALFRVGVEWAVFVVDNGRARQRTVSLARHNGIAAAIASGLDAGDVIIVHPGDRVSDGVRVVARTAAAMD